ncbi:MAG: sulfotransferase family 2 domain-containing protein [Acidobacteria bacterium]|nr:sulfotransferase family 2 domain-containing protein [Acidobacteriota bacterium]
MLRQDLRRRASSRVVRIVRDVRTVLLDPLLADAGHGRRCDTVYFERLAAMKPDARDAARVAYRLLRRTGLAGALSSGGQRDAGLLQGTRHVAGVETLRLVGRCLAASATVEHRAVAIALAAALDAGNHAAALEMVATAGLRPDLRAEKIVSRRYGFLWICNPKVASRSIMSALRSADPDAELFREQTLSEVAAARPEARHYVSFAFVRHPCARTFSCYADKHTLARSQTAAQRYFIERFHGVRRAMSFVEFSRWLNTACGSDAFADRHWLSQQPFAGLHRLLRAFGCGLGSRVSPRGSATPAVAAAESQSGRPASREPAERGGDPVAEATVRG